MWRNKIWDSLEQYGAYLFGPILILCSIVVSQFVGPRVPNCFTEELAVALMIAGILTMTVDPFIKRRARAEATRDIFHHMLGFGLPLSIRERLQEMVEKTKLYRQDMTLHIVMSEDKDSVVFDVEMEFEVVNPTSHALDFAPLIQFEKGEGALKSVTCFGESGYGKNAGLSSAKGGLGSVEYRGDGVRILSGGSRRFKYEYAIRYPTTLGFWFPNFVSPTIGLALTMKIPANFSVRATAAEYEASGEWRYPNKLFMPNEHLEIVWEKLR